MKKWSDRMAMWAAMHDMSEYFREQNIKIMDPKTYDVLVVTPSMIATKQATRLNRELGLHKINKDKNGRNFRPNKNEHE